MKALIKMSLRGLRRDLRRSLVTGSTIALGLALFIFTDQLSQGTYQQLLTTGISTQAGHLIIQHKGYNKDPKMSDALADGGAMIDEIEIALRAEGVDARIAPRAQLNGILRAPAGIARVMILAIDPQREAPVSDWEDQLVDAPRPAGEVGAPLKSEWLNRGDDQGILLGAPLAQQLDVTVGDKVVLSVQVHDEVESQLFRVRGLIKTGMKSADSMMALCTLTAGRKALGLKDGLHQITVHLDAIDDLERASSIIHTGLKKRSEAANHSQIDRQAEVIDWKQALPGLYQFTLKDRQSARVIFFIIGLIIAIGVLNTITMSVLERSRHFGVMLALGLPPRSIGAMIILESALLGAISALAGLVLGVGVSWLGVEYGIDMSGMTGDELQLEGVRFSSVVYLVWHPEGLITFPIAAWILSIVAGIWPAWRAAHISPLVAMRGQ